MLNLAAEIDEFQGRSFVPENLITTKGTKEIGISPAPREDGKTAVT